MDTEAGLVADKPSAKNVLRKVRDGLVSVIIALTRVVFFWLPGGDIAHGQALTAVHPMIIGSVILAFFVVLLLFFHCQYKYVAYFYNLNFVDIETT